MEPRLSGQSAKAIPACFVVVAAPHHIRRTAIKRTAMAQRLTKGEAGLESDTIKLSLIRYDTNEPDGGPTQSENQLPETALRT